MKRSTDSPLIYACSGCSSIAQLANAVAVRLDREGVAEMSCIAGVGGGVKSLVKKARSGRPIIALDGCELHCARHCLANASVEADWHLTLTRYGIKKRYHQDYAPDDVIEITNEVKNVIQSTSE